MFSYTNRLCDGFFPFGDNIVFIVGFLLLALLAYFIIKKVGITDQTEIETPLELLQKRYVKGEISKDEYLEKKDMISK